MTFHVEVRSAGDVTIIDLAGDLNRDADAALAATHEQAVADRERSCTRVTGPDEVSAATPRPWRSLP